MADAGVDLLLPFANLDGIFFAFAQRLLTVDQYVLISINTSTSLMFYLMSCSVCVPHSSTLSYSISDSLQFISSLCHLMLFCSLPSLPATSLCLSLSLPFSFCFKLNFGMMEIKRVIKATVSTTSMTRAAIKKYYRHISKNMPLISSRVKFDKF